MLYHMSSTEYLNYEAGKFSKSKGIGVFGTDVMETGIPADVWRFYIFYNRPEKADALFTWKDFETQVNKELIGNLGNLVNRTLSFVSRYYDGKIPTASLDGKFWATVEDYEAKISEKFEKADERDAFHTIFELSDFANKTFQAAEPWKKRVEAPEEAQALIGSLSYVVRDLAIMLYPFIPESAEKIASFLGQKIGKGGLNWDSLGSKGNLATVDRPQVLFAKLEDKLINELRDKYSGSQEEREKKSTEDTEKEKKNNKNNKNSVDSVPPAVKYSSPEEQFAHTVALRTAEILTVERIPKADKLFKLTLNIGSPEQPENRVICSGLVGFYTEEQLLHKHIIVAYNLKARMMRGVESKGMLLAAGDVIKNADGSETEIVDVLDSGSVPSGTWVSLEDHYLKPEDMPAEITIDQFMAVRMSSKDYVINVNGKALLLGGPGSAKVKAAVVANGEVH
jgi:methionyl-tRNA synthetase